LANGFEAESGQLAKEYDIRQILATKNPAPANNRIRTALASESAMRADPRDALVVLADK